MPPKKSRRSAFFLAAIVIFGLVLRLYFFAGVGTSDDLLNTKYSYDISKNVFPTTQNPANSRLGLLMPVSILYSEFGVNDVTSTIFVLLASLGGIVLIYFFGKLLFGEKVGILAAFLLSIFPLDVIYSTRFLSDLPSAFFASLAIFIFLKCENAKNKSGANIFYLLSGICVGIAFAVREMAVLAILFFLIYVLYNKKFKSGYFVMAAGFLIMLSLEMLFFYAHTGNPFHRFESLGSYYVSAVYSHNFYGRLSFPEFFLAYPYVIFNDLGLRFFYIMISLALLYSVVYRKRETNYLLIWFLSILLYLSFGTSSITKYVPFFVVARYLSYITFPAILLLSAFLLEKDELIKKVLLPFALVLLLATSIGVIYLDYLDNSRHSLDNLRAAYLDLQSMDKQVYTDSRTRMAIEYLSGYHNGLNLSDLESYQKDLREIKNSYILINRQMIKSRQASGEDIKFLGQLKIIPDNWKKIKEIGKIQDEKIVIYYAG